MSGPVGLPAVRRVEAEEPDARIPTLAMDVRPHVGLVEARYPADGGKPTGRTPVMVNGTRPTYAVPSEQVELELGRDEREQLLGGNGQCRNEKVPPASAASRAADGLSGWTDPVDARGLIRR